MRSGGGRRAPSILAGLLGIAAAVVTVLMREITVVVLIFVAGILLIGVGIAEIMIAVRLRQICGETFLALAGLVCIIAGVVILIWPLFGALALTFVLGVYALVSGVLLLGLALRLRHLVRSGDVPAPGRPGAGSATWPQPGTP